MPFHNFFKNSDRLGDFEETVQAATAVLTFPPNVPTVWGEMRETRPETTARLGLAVNSSFVCRGGGGRDKHRRKKRRRKRRMSPLVQVVTEN